MKYAITAIVMIAAAGGFVYWWQRRQKEKATEAAIAVVAKPAITGGTPGFIIPEGAVAPVLKAAPFIPGSKAVDALAINPRLAAEVAAVQLKPRQTIDFNNPATAPVLVLN